jgi:CheY-like chemotaxis protein
MKKKLTCIMLVDDNPNDNFFHERVIKKWNAADDIAVVAKQTGTDALEYLRSRERGDDLHPNLIFLDINMPGMNGWEFLEEYKRLDERFRSHAVVVMLTTSDNPDDRARANANGGAWDFKTKPLTREMLEEVIGKYFAS